MFIGYSNIYERMMVKYEYEVFYFHNIFFFPSLNLTIHSF